MNFESISAGINNITGFINKLSQEIDITYQDIGISKLESSLNGLTIAQISDLHIHEWNIDLVEEAIKTLNSLNPDIVVVTGDVICNGKKFIPDLIRIFKQIEARHGKFACLGNHDHSDGDNSFRVQNFYKKADFQILINDSSKVTIQGESLYLAGADDVELGVQNIVKMIRKVPKDATSVFLTHNPYNVDEFTKYSPDLVLAGHTHGGQLYFSILNFLYKLRLGTYYLSGLYSVNKSKLYVNRGIGTAVVTPKIFNKKFIINTPRINSSPEITLFRLVPEYSVSS